MRSSRALGASALFTFALVVATGVLPAGAQTLPEVPALPADTAPAQQVAGPAGWAGCNTAATALFVAIFASGLVPSAPVPVPVPVAAPTPGDVLYNYANPALAQACGLFGPPASAAACTTDGSLAAVPFVALKPAGTVVATVAGTEAAAAGQGAPATGVVSGPVGGNLGCGSTASSPLPPAAAPVDLTDLPSDVGTTPDAASEVLGHSVENGRASQATTERLAGAGQVAASGLGGSDGTAEQAAALAASTGPKWTPLRITAVALITALLLVLMLRWLALAPATVGGTRD